MRIRFESQVKKQAAQMSLEEKVALMSGRFSLFDMLKQGSESHYNNTPFAIGGNIKYKVEPLMFCDGTRGAVQGTGTCFPVVSARGATFDVRLEKRIGQSIGREVSAKGGNLFAGVCANIPYHMGWGRSQECYGEDAYHAAGMSAALVRGVQSKNVIACVKHYAFYGVEQDRFNKNISADKRTEREFFLLPFKACVQAGAGAFLCAFNLYNGEYCSQHRYLINDVLRREWGFDGIVLSEFYYGVHDTKTAALSGLDIEMCYPKYYGAGLIKAVKSGKIDERIVDAAAVRIIRTSMKWEKKRKRKKTVDIEKHEKLAQMAAEKAITLLQNERQVLPFSKSETKRIVILGRLGDAPNMGDNGSSQVFAPYHISPLEGISQLLPESRTVYYGGENIGHAIDLAKSADAVVIVAGYDSYDEGEYYQFENTRVALGGDRRDALHLHEQEIELIKEAGKVNKNTAVVLIGSGMILLESWRHFVPSVLLAYYPGMMGGRAIARALFGDIVPGGKTPFAIPQKAGDLPFVPWEDSNIKYEYDYGYMKLDRSGNPPSVPFGFGLSYTRFSLSAPKFWLKRGVICASCKVKNTGQYKGDEVIQMYVGFSHSKVKRPVKVLRGFRRITLAPGMSRTVVLRCGLSDICWYNPEKEKWELELMEYEVYIGNSASHENLFSGAVEVKKGHKFDPIC